MIRNLKAVIRSFSRSFIGFLEYTTNKLVHSLLDHNLKNVITKFRLGYAIRGWLILVCRYKIEIFAMIFI